MSSKPEDTKSGGAEDKTTSVDVPSTTTTDLKSPSPNRSSTLPGLNGAASSPSQNKSRFNLGASGVNGSATGAGEAVGMGAKSMPGSRRTSAMVGSGGAAGQDGTFGLDKLSLSTGQVTEGREEDVGAEGARGELGWNCWRGDCREADIWRGRC